MQISARFRHLFGFTLVELLVVISIIAILGVVAFAVINPSQRLKDATDARAFGNVETLSKSFETCVSDRLLAGRGPAGSTDDCCGTNVAFANCVGSTGLYVYGLGYEAGFPPGVVVNRGDAGSSSICVSQAQGSGTAPNNNIKYIVGGGTLQKNTTACNQGA